MFSLGKKKKSLVFQKVPFCQCCFCSQRSCQTIQTKIGIVLKPPYQDLNEMELEALTVSHFHPKFPNCWFDLCGIDPCSLWKPWWLFPLQQHAQEQRANEEQGGFWAPQISLPRQSPPVNACRGAGTAGTQHVLGLSPSAKHLYPLASYRAGMEVSESPTWSSCSRREGEEFSCPKLFDFMRNSVIFFCIQS